MNGIVDGVITYLMKSMQLNLERFDIHELGFPVHLPPELEVSECARTKPVEDLLSCARTSALKGVRKEKPHFGQLPIRIHRKGHGSVVACSSLLPELLSPHQNIDVFSLGRNFEKRVTFSEKCDLIDRSDVYYGNVEPDCGDMSDIVDVGVYTGSENEENG